MVNAQEWLDQNYLLETRTTIKKLIISEKGLRGVLSLVGFSKLEELVCDNNFLNSLDLSTCPELIKLNCSYQKNNQLANLNLSGCSNLAYLDCSDNQLTELDLSTCPRLIKVKCQKNQLTRLKIINLPCLEKFTAWNNHLTELNWLALNPEKLVYLSVSNNKFSQQDLSYFTRFVNLEELWIGTNIKDRIEQRIYNRFTGSLEPLKNLTKLRQLYIEGTDIDGGLEHLPESLEKIIYYLSYDYEGDFKVKKLEEELQVCKGEEKLTYYDYQAWRNWNKRGFDSQEVEQWIKAGLKISEYDFAIYLKQKDFHSSSPELKSLIKEHRQVQNWLDFNYPLERRNHITRLDISDKELEGHLDLTDFTNLEVLNCEKNRLTSLDASNCSKLSVLKVGKNSLTNLDLSQFGSLTELHCPDNQLTSAGFLVPLPRKDKLIVLIISNNKIKTSLTVFQEFISLESLSLNSNHFYGSLEPLKDLISLKTLNISDTNIDSGLEYLLESLEKFYCSVNDKKSENEVSLIEQGLRKYGEPNDNNFANLLEPWKREYQIRQQQQQIQLLKKQGILFEKKDKEIIYLEQRVQELVDLIENQKSKIFSIFTRLLPEQKEELELIRNLIFVHLEYIKVSKQKMPSVSLRKQRDKLRSDLEEKLEDNLEEEIESVLNDCTDLVIWGIELEIKLNSKTPLIEDQKKNLILKTVKNSEEKTKLEERETTHEKQIQQKRKMSYDTLERNFFETWGQLIVLKEENEKKYEIIREATLTPKNQWKVKGDALFSSQSIINTYVRYQQLETDLKQQTSEILTNQEITLQDQQVITQTVIYLGSQELFIDYRQKLLDKLIDGYCQLTRKTKWTKWVAFGSNLTGIGSKIAGAIPKGTTAQTSLGIIGDIINLAANITQERNLEKYRQKLQEILTKDKEALTLFDSYYHPLEKTVYNQSTLITTQIIKTLSLSKEQPYPFSKGQDPFQGIWEKELTSFSSDQLKDFLKKLEGDLETFQKNLQQQKSELYQYEWFKILEAKTDLLQEQSQNQIQVDPK